MDINSKIKDSLPLITIFFVSVVITVIFQASGMFGFFELKLYDFRFRLRGAISGLANPHDSFLPQQEKFTDKNGDFLYSEGIDEFDLENDINGNGKWDKGLDVVLVEKDDESFRLIKEPTPYTRKVYASAVRNLAKAGAKVIVFDIEFDKEDHQMQNVNSLLSEEDLSKIDLIHSDKLFIEAISFANTLGTKVVLAGKTVYESTRIPPISILYPHKSLMDIDPPPYVGMVDVREDIDGIYRLYPVYASTGQDNNKYFSLAVSSVLRYLDIDKDPEVVFDIDNNIIKIDPLEIQCYGLQQYFMLNLQGPPSNAAYGETQFKTFNRYPLSNIIDTKDYVIGEAIYDPDFEEWEYLEDSDWMDKYIDPNNFLFSRFEKQNPFRNKIVVIGTSLPEDHDFKNTAYLNYEGVIYNMPGMEYHANAMQHLIDANYIKYPLGTLSIGSLSGENLSAKQNRSYLLLHTLLITIITLITLLLVSRFEPIMGLLVIMVELVIWLSYSIGAFFNDYLWLFKYASNSIIGNNHLLNSPGIGESVLLPVIFPAASIIVPYGLNLSYKLITESQNKKFLKDSFGQYISPELIDQMFEEKKEPKLGGDPGYHSMLFSDIASFSTFSEKLEPDDLLTLLNQYLTAMTDILIGNKGTLDKYIGDAIVAFYGAPIEIENHEYRACKTAIEMEKKLTELRAKWKGEGDKWPEIVHNMQHRVGINAGNIVVGNMGSEMKMNYTMTGDKVNLTARLESSAKQFGIVIQVSDTIYKKNKDNFIFRDLGKVVVVGRNQHLNTYELIGEPEDMDDNLAKLLEIFHKGLDCYYNQEWDKAIELFKASNELEDMHEGRKKNPSLVFISRCEEFKKNPPDKDWGGVYSLTSK